jgi:hypothetical protein
MLHMRTRVELNEARQIIVANRFELETSLDLARSSSIADRAGLIDALEQALACVDASAKRLAELEERLAKEDLDATIASMSGDLSTGDLAMLAGVEVR